MIFPRGTVYSKLDAITRQVLWREGLNYGHGTGHGVGAGLLVHEPPAGVLPQDALHQFGISEPPVEEHMVVTIEPGYYLENKYGIRIESDYEVMVGPKRTDDLNEPAWLRFQPLTLVPFDRKLIDADLLSQSEKSWLNHYYKKIRATLLPALEIDNSISSNRTKIWILNQTEPI
ncbi:hypothetical protein Ciccas_010855 [Cichlidogyrus casuarinus]|uniref:Uncharacterized protein n=1 Tax=Cichlidogyrus casuarinus TaxID=1844966 RepID=A0ABD2PSX2_9PLAT